MIDLVQTETYSALVRNISSVFHVPYRREVVTVELSPLLITQIVINQGDLVNALSASSNPHRPGFAYLVDILGRAREEQDYDAELITDEGIRVVRVSISGAPIASPILLTSEVHAFLAQEPDYAFDQQSAVYFPISATELLIADGNDERSVAWALEASIQIFQNRPEAVSPCPYRIVDNKLTVLNEVGDSGLAERITNTTRWFSQIMHTRLKEYFTDGPESDWFKNEKLSFVEPVFGDAGVLATIKASEFNNGAQLLMPAVNYVKFVDDEVDEYHDEVIASLESLYKIEELCEPEPDMRPVMFRIRNFPTMLQMRDLKRLNGQETE